MKAVVFFFYLKKNLKQGLMSSNRYNAINSPLQRTETRYYSVVEITNSLERYGSSQLDQDIFGITVIRSTKDQQMCK
jgi:hypothetical protein